MEITQLKLFTDNFQNQIRFYRDLLGFDLFDISEHHFCMQAGHTKLTFENSKEDIYYHFAFLIPTNKLDEAITFLQNRDIALLKYKRKNIIDFGEGKSVYFHDANQNIVEFIERPALGYTTQLPFSIDRVIKINEIGLPVENTIHMTEKLIEKFKIRLINPENISDQFCWVGDFNGAIIVTKISRNWLPTNTPGIINDFCIEFKVSRMHHAVCFRNNEMAVWQVPNNKKAIL